MEPKLTSATIQTLYSHDTEYSSDSVEWCPHKPHQNIFVCANYHLLDDRESLQQKRIGRILLFSVDPREGLQLIQTLKTPAILDQKWCHTKLNGYSILGIVNADNTIEIYKLDFVEKVKLEILSRYVCPDDVSVGLPEKLILSLDWSTGKYESQMAEIVCSDSKGNIHRLKLQDEKLELCRTWHAHEYEAWIAAFYYWNINIVFTGGDDCLLLQFDERVGSSPVLKNNVHQAGVTSIHSNSEEEYLLATGSYDTFLRLWDIRNMKRAKDELEMPGTLWRLKWNPHDYKFLLAACMLGGVHVVNTDNDAKIVESYYKHENLAYGADWSYLSGNELTKFDGSGNFLVASCSFYDHLLCIWMSSCTYQRNIETA